MAESADHEDLLEGLEERLQGHAKAFESLLALTPAREYYGSHFVDGQDPSEQWNRKKQTKEQKRAAKKAKLDPANQKSALDVIKEQEAKALKKRKRDAGEEDVESEKVDEKTKRRKGEDDADAAEARRRARAARRKERREKKHADKKVKADAKKARKEKRDSTDAPTKKQPRGQDKDGVDVDEDSKLEEDEQAPDVEDMDFSGLGDLEQDHRIEKEVDDAASDGSSAPTTPLLDSPAFDIATNHSDGSSSSSIVPPSIADQPSQPRRPQKKPSTKPVTSSSVPKHSESSPKPTDPPSGTSSPKVHIPSIPHEEAQERLRKRIEEMRAKRKADGQDGKAAKSRQELVEQRRKKEELRKAARKAQWQKEKDDEQRRREEQLRGSGSPLSVDIFSPRSPQPQEKSSNNYSFSRLAFEDGTSADPALTTLQESRKKKGPQDPKTALQAAQSKQSRIAGYDAEKKADIVDKDMWLNARKKAHGERVRDDTSLLKKALKRKEQAKSKSEKAWKEREQSILKGREMKQKKREANLQKRKDEKGGKGKKKKGGKKPGGGGGKKKARPGFEGRFKA